MRPPRDIHTLYDVIDTGYTTPCWIWRAAKSHDYAYITRNYKAIRLYVYLYEQKNGKVPVGLILDHLCKNKSCINPDHLEPVTQKVNILRGNSIQANNARKTHCPNGHEYTPENTYIVPKWGSRQCKKCRSTRDRKLWKWSKVKK